MKKLYKVSFIVSIILVLSMLITSCASTTEPEAPATEPEAPEAEGTPFKAAMLTDLGGLAGSDEVKGFSDLGWDALLQARDDLGIEVTLLEAKELADLEPNLRKMASEGYQFVVGVGFLFTDAIDAVAPDFPDTHFAIIDSVVEQPNVASIVFGEEQGSFLVGAIAAGMSETGVIGFIGGMESPLIEKFEAGYVAGARAINPDIRVLTNYAGSFTDVAAGKEISLTQNNQGADVIYSAAGSVGLGAIQAAEDQGFWAIGVDIDQDGLAPGHVLTSMLKHVEIALFDVLKSAYEGNFEGGIHLYDLAVGGVGYSDLTYTRDAIPQDLLDQVDALAERIVAGEIVVPSLRADADVFVLP